MDKTTQYKRPRRPKTDDQTLIEVCSHYDDWQEDNQKRMYRKNGWNDVTDAYWGRLPEDWPYISRVIDPRIRTSLIEKNARLLNSRLRGRLVPREGADVLGAKINNSVLDFQWDNANHGGSMQVKMSICDLDTRLYGSKYAYVPWIYECDEDGKVLFDGNELEPLDIRDCGMDFQASHVRNAKWFQHRSWQFLDELESRNKHASEHASEPVFKNLDLISKAIHERGYKRSDTNTEYVSRIKQLKELEDRTGEDIAFPVVELVTEYRANRWITFAPKYNLILRDIPNPFKHGKIPIAQLRYYPIQDDPNGESEVEPVLPLWKAIQAVVCGFLDEMNIKMNPPLKIIEGAVRMETVEFGPKAQWLMSRPDAIMEYQSNGEAQQWFQTTYSSMVAAFNTAMGDTSQGVSTVDMFNPEKTATEVKQSAKQQNTRDQKNQSDLAEFIKDIMSMWQSNNKQFLFSNPKKQEYVQRIVGTESFTYFKKAGLDQMDVPDESMQMLSDIVTEIGGELSDGDLNELYESAKVPLFPVFDNPDEKNPEKIKMKPKMRISDMGDSAELSIIPEDLDGNFDYIADVKSMASGASEELASARQQAIEQFKDPTILSLLQMEGFKPAIKELLTSTLEELGLKDADRFFEQIQNDPLATTGQALGVGGPQPPVPNPGMPGLPGATPQGIPGQQMAGPVPVQG